MKFSIRLLCMPPMNLNVNFAEWLMYIHLTKVLVTLDIYVVFVALLLYVLNSAAGRANSIMKISLAL